MKRIVTAILALTLLLSLCACGKNAGSQTQNGENDLAISGDQQEKPVETLRPYDPAADVPTAEEAADLEAYEQIARLLAKYEETGKNRYEWVYGTGERDSFTLRGGAALAVYYQQLLALESVDKWFALGGFAENYAPFQPQGEEAAITIEPRQTVLARFTLLGEQQVIQAQSSKDKETGEFLKERSYHFWEYDAQGRLIQKLNIDMAVPMSYVVPMAGYEYLISYDENGHVAQRSYEFNSENGIVYIPSKLTHDANGNVVQEEVTTPSGIVAKAEFTYDSQGRVAAMVWNDISTDNYVYTDTYTYDDQGRRSLTYIVNGALIEYDGSVVQKAYADEQITDYYLPYAIYTR